jgi:hypothetical protein
MRWVGHITYMGERRGFWWGKVGDRDHCGDPSVGGRIILRWIFRNWHVGRAMDWIELAQDRDRWWAPVNTVMNLQVPQNEENFLTS